MKLKTCKICKIKFEPYNSLQNVCSPKCAIELTNRLNDKKKLKQKQEWNKEKAERKEALKTRSDYLRELQTLVNKFVRLRDINEPCISCGTTKQDIVYHAGHFHSIKAYPSIRFDLDNIWKQCGNNCNVHLSGNLLNYREGLIKRIGMKRFNALEERKNVPLKLTIEEIKQQKSFFRAKIKDME